MRHLTLLVVALTIVFATSARAEEPSRERLLRLFEVTGVENQMEIMIDSLRTPMLQMVKPALRKVATQQGLVVPDNFDQIADEEYNKAFGAAGKDMLAELTPLYQKAYSAADVEELITFYDSDLGRRLVATTAEVSKVSVAMGQVIGAKYGAQLGQGIMRRLQKSNGVDN